MAPPAPRRVVGFLRWPRYSHASRDRPEARRAAVGYVERHLLPDERVLYKTRLHWILLLRPALLLALGLAILAVAWRMQAQPAIFYLGGAVAAAGVLWGLVHFVEMMTSEFAVTNIR